MLVVVKVPSGLEAFFLCVCWSNQVVCGYFVCDGGSVREDGTGMRGLG